MATPVAQVLTVCGANDAEILALEGRERLDTLDDYADMLKEEGSALAAKLERRTIVTGRVILPTKVIKNVQALCFWASE